MDIRMPLMDGMTATRTIRSLPDWAETPVIAVTANALDEDRLSCLAAGMNDFLAKPVDPESFYATLLKWLSAGPATADAIRPEETALSALPAAPDPERIADTLQALGLLLEQCDTRAISLVREDTPLLTAALGDSFDMLRRQLAIFDFDAALVTLMTATGTASASCT